MLNCRSDPISRWGTLAFGQYFFRRARPETEITTARGLKVAASCTRRPGKPDGSET